jgi:carbamoyltransferase
MILGINSQNHDASLALVEGRNILWAAHAERYSRVKNDNRLNLAMIDEMRLYGEPTEIVWFEKPLLKSFRKFYSGERPWYCNPKEELKKIGLDHLPITYINHHKSHAAAGFYTSGYSDASILVVDAIGEWNTVSIWQADSFGLKKYWTKNYPNSMGLFYTAFTQYLGLKPNEEEYILMGMAAYGKLHNDLIDQLKTDFFQDFNPPNFKLKHNLHQGCCWWELPSQYTKYDLAAAVQSIMEEYLTLTVNWIGSKLPSRNLIFMGGCALNCVANSLIAKNTRFDNIWIMPNPGDAGSAIGAIAAYSSWQLNWQGPYLGTDIDRELDIENVVNELLAGNVVAVANGRAEFGPRALGNRSLLCDPRGPNAKDRMNAIKKRERFRPFAPAVLEEHAATYFDMPVKSSPYMQFVAQCKDPVNLPGICHIDNTSRVQTVNYSDNVKFRELLQLWYEKTGCPMLMNTSLNIKGEPLVNSWGDARRFQQLNGIKIF